jgi:hypothetical protein
MSIAFELGPLRRQNGTAPIVRHQTRKARHPLIAADRQLNHGSTPPLDPRCRGYCEGWRDPDTFGQHGGFHFQVNTVEQIDATHAKVHGYWCAGGFDSDESLVVVSANGFAEPVTVVEFDPAPQPGWDSRPHLRSITVSAAEGVVAPGTCIRTIAK